MSYQEIVMIVSSGLHCQSIVKTVNMEKETSLRVLNSLKVDNDSASSGNPEDHNDSDHRDTSPGETIENDQVEENADEDITGFVINYLVFVKVR